ncbi:MAG: translocation/assembly module TamB domain-containing protein [Bacteroidetes bacterium]|nr:translocation/assembly module TamB domain-containing protein [Bacteroidota bacterium]
MEWQPLRCRNRYYCTLQNLRASTYDLLQDTSNRKRIPVELSLQLTGNLFNPNVKFNIDVPGLDASLQNQLRSRLSTEQELNRQVFSLLVLNRFSPPEESRNTANENGSSNSVGANAGELLSNQVTNWLSKLSKDVNIGVNYRPGDELNRKDEFEVSLSTEIFNDRVSIDGSFGVNNNNTSSSASNVVGDFNVEFKASRDGRVRLRAFNKTNTNTYLNYLNSQYTQGIGIFYREEFNTRKELVATFKERRAKKEKQSSNNSSMR